MPWVVKVFFFDGKSLSFRGIETLEKAKRKKDSLLKSGYSDESSPIHKYYPAHSIQKVEIWETAK
ncbi:MAG: hypothetical protein PVH84_06755 [Candidatus Aminicenantes bacterium]